MLCVPAPHTCPVYPACCKLAVIVSWPARRAIMQALTDTLPTLAHNGMHDDPVFNYPVCHPVFARRASTQAASPKYHLLCRSPAATRMRSPPAPSACETASAAGEDTAVPPALTQPSRQAVNTELLLKPLPYKEDRYLIDHGKST